MEIKDVAIFKIDHTSAMPERREFRDDNEDLRSYIVELLEKISTEKGNRKFKFESDTTQMRVVIGKFVNEPEQFSENANTSANRLLAKEIVAQREYAHLTEIPKGSILHTVIAVDGLFKVVIAKVDHNEFLEEDNLTKKTGIPIKKKIYKALLVEFDSENNIENTLVYDTNASISKYWWYDYLELSEVNTNNYNTDTSLTFIQKELNKIKKKSEVDYGILYNRVLGFYMSNDSFEVENFIANVFTGYTPESPEVSIDNIINKVRELPTTKDFDGAFDIDRSVLKGKRMQRIVPLDEGKIELHIKGYLENMNEIITPKEIDNEKYLLIKTEQGFKAFQKMEDERN